MMNRIEVCRNKEAVLVPHYILARQSCAMVEWAAHPSWHGQRI